MKLLKEVRFYKCKIVKYITRTINIVPRIHQKRCADPSSSGISFVAMTSRALQKLKARQAIAIDKLNEFI